MASGEFYLSSEWEEKWRAEKERWKRTAEEGGEGAERNEQELRRIVAYNDAKMGRSSAGRNGASAKQVCEGPSVDETLNYAIENYACDIFGILVGFWKTSVLTDLILVSGNGQRYLVHNPVLAALSSSVRRRLAEEKSLRGWTLNLGSEVDDVGLQAVLEFAYAGVVPSWNEETVESVIAAAKAMEIARMVEICGTRTGKSGPQDGRQELKKTLEEINQLRSEDVGCDVVLDVNGVFYHAHRVILAASSHFFRGMFTSGMKECSQSCVALPFPFAPELEALIGCSYTGRLHLNWDCVFEIACTALQLQFSPALSLCFKFMPEQIDTDSCLDVISFAEAYGMTELRDDANDFVLRNFWEVSETAKFLDLSAEQLVHFLKCDGLCAPSELAVFRSVISWIKASPAERLNQASVLMSAVRFPLMTFREFREVRAINLQMECAGNSAEVELHASALKEFMHQDTRAQCRVRKPKDALVLVGGDQLNPDVGRRIPSREVWFANGLRRGTGLIKDIEWRKLAEIPDQPKFRHGVAAIGGELYVIGGCYFYTKEDIMKSAYRYNPEQSSWRRLADMNEFRSNFSLIANERRLFAIGGDKEINTNVDSVEMYDPDTDSWSFVRPLNRALSGQAASVCDGSIFISGGFNSQYECLVSLFLYHPAGGSTYLHDMSRDRAQHSMDALRGHLYVVGGVCNLQSFYTDQLVCEVYSPGADSWSVLGNLPVAHVGAASVVLEDKLYVLGGYCQEDYTESGRVHRFDPSINKWESMGRLPGAVTDIRACLMHLPHRLRQ
ncbi:kelch-like protein 33 [Eucyclogobius newberryi]|uniref:kelch-like protein 33 n=1 Tax=Eucyclogobius newberryi TaxID=166745 RepID=UPI003B5AEA6F